MKYITVHCSATPNDPNIDAEVIDMWHKGQGWSQIGYHIVITTSGEVEAGRPLDRTGAHVKGHNYENIGICLIGGVDDNGKPEDNFNASQKMALKSVVQTLQHVYSISDRNVKGHRDWFLDTNGDGVVDSRDWLKECPCFDVQRFLRGDYSGI